MCTVEIPDNVMEQAGLKDGHDAAIEVACRLYDAQRISARAATDLAGLSRSQFWDELKKRGLPQFRVTDEYWRQELGSLESGGAE